MGKRKGKPSKKLKKLIQKKRDIRSVQEARFAIQQSIMRKINLEAESMTNIGSQFTVTGKGEPIITGDVDEARTFESPKLKAYRFIEGMTKKIVIENLSRSEDDGFGMLDTIHAMIDESGFPIDSSLRIYLTAGSEKERDTIESYLEALDPKLMTIVSFVNRGPDRIKDEGAGAGSAKAEMDDNDDSDIDKRDVVPAEPVMNEIFLSRLMGEDPKKKSTKYMNVVNVLKEYHAQLSQFKLDMVNNGDNQKQFNEHVIELDKIVKKAIPIVDTYISDSKSKKLFITSSKKDKKDAMQVLKTQLLNINRLNSNADLERLRKENWIQRLKPLTDIDINNSADNFTVGVAAQGEVILKSVTFKGPPPFVAAVKIDDVEKWNMEAMNSGIPQDNPEQSKRSVSAYLLNQYLSMDVLPKTQFVVRTNNETGKTEFGQAIEYVTGQIGQMHGIDKNEVIAAKSKLLLEAKERVERGKPEPPPPGEDRKDYLAKVDAYTNAVAELEKFAFVDGKFHAYTNKPPNINYRSPVVQKQLADLQILDNVLGHADRHGENIIFQFAEDGSITGLKGIDNDDTFGSDWRPKDPRDKTTSKTPGLPPFIDIDTALNIFRLSPEKIRDDLQNGLENKLDEDAIEVGIIRLISTQAKIKALIEQGEMKIATNQVQADQGKVDLLERVAKLLPGFLNGKVKTWGNDTFDAHISTNTVPVEINVNSGNFRDDIVENSYLGTMLTLGKERGFEDLPE